MARFDVYSLSARNQLIIDVQADLFVHLETRLVVPLLSAGKKPLFSMTRLNPVFTIENSDYYMNTAQMAAIPASLLKNKKVNLEDQRQQIIDALDFLMQGF